MFIGRSPLICALYIPAGHALPFNELMLLVIRSRSISRPVMSCTMIHEPLEIPNRVKASLNGFGLTTIVALSRLFDTCADFHEYRTRVTVYQTVRIGIAVNDVVGAQTSNSWVERAT